MMKMNKELLKEYARKGFDFACICAYILGAIGGIAYLFYDHHSLFGVAGIAVSAMAVPFVIKRVKSLLS